MLTASYVQTILGDPHTERYMRLMSIPTSFPINSVIPRRIYCYPELAKRFAASLDALADADLLHEIKTYDGCFNIRKQRHSLVRQSLHSWGLAVDLNASYSSKKTCFSPGFVRIFKEHGFDWGGDWSIPDRMHFQLSQL